MSLVSEINSKRREIKTDGYPLSISEWTSMYQASELDIHPEFQRFFRWTDAQKAALIESILLGIPLPPIFVSQREDGVWDVVDGLQRLSTIFEFMGILKDEKGALVPPLVLEGTKYLPSLEGVHWISSGPKDTKSLPKDLQLLIKRAKIGASIVLKESDDSAKYDLFQRLNTGGSQLSPQEVRNCLLVMVNREFYDWLKSLKTNTDFVDATALSERPLEEAYDTELALRFILLSTIVESELKGVGDIGAFLTERAVELATNRRFKKAKAAGLFRRSFEVINATLGDNAFKRYNKQKKRHEGGFLLSLFEVIALGVAFNVENGTLCEETEIPERAKLLWSNKSFTQWATSGMTATRRLPHLIPLGRQVFKK